MLVPDVKRRPGVDRHFFVAMVMMMHDNDFVDFHLRMQKYVSKANALIAAHFGEMGLSNLVNVPADRPMAGTSVDTRMNPDAIPSWETMLMEWDPVPKIVVDVGVHDWTMVHLEAIANEPDVGGLPDGLPDDPLPNYNHTGLV